MPCVEACRVTWWSGSGAIQALSQLLTALIVTEMTYDLLSGTLNLYTISACLILY